MHRYGKEDFDKYDGNIQYGRIIRYSHENGYGFLRTSCGKDLFISSYSFISKKDENVRLGTIVSFIIVSRNNKYLADKVRVIERFPNGKHLNLPNGSIINIGKIEFFRYLGEQKCILFKMRKGETIIISNEDLYDETAIEYFTRLTETYLCLPENLKNI